MRGFTVLLVALTLVGPSVVSAQEFASIQPGSRVRVTAPECGLDRQLGILEPSHGDTVVIGTDISTEQCSLANVTRLDASDGRKVRAGRALGFPLAGLLVGGIAGGLVGYSTCAPCHHELDGLAPAAGVVLGGTVGFVTGLVVGLLPREHWEEVSLDRVHLSLATKPIGRFSIGLSVAF